MKKIYFLLALLLIGCEAQAVCKNETIYINNTVIKEVEKIVNVSPTYIRKYTIAENASQREELVSCRSKFRQCDIALRYQGDELWDCLSHNNTKYSENITDEYKECVEDRDKYKEIVEKIEEIVD